MEREENGCLLRAEAGDRTHDIQAVFPPHSKLVALRGGWGLLSLSASSSGDCYCRQHVKKLPTLPPPPNLWETQLLEGAGTAVNKKTLFGCGRTSSVGASVSVSQPVLQTILPELRTSLFLLYLSGDKSGRGLEICLAHH